MAVVGAREPAPATTKRRRDAIFQESWKSLARRWLFGTAFALKPSRIASVPYLLWYAAVDVLGGGTRVPDPARARPRPDSFGGICRDLSPETILAAARIGFFPWSHFGPIKWWTRAERMVLFFPEQHIAKRFRPMMRKSPWRVTFDTAFDEVIKACAEPRSNRRFAMTWITPKIMRLYAELHDQGHAHSVEVWGEDGRLIGGCYGVSVGRVFVTESLFFREHNASKMGYHVLNYHLAKWGYVINDTKDWTEMSAAAGFRLVPRSEFEAILAQSAHEGGRAGRWSIEADIAAVANSETKGTGSKASNPEAL
jgi:leucyl/phenylalanyl-tRNA--protein transferase